MQSQKIFLKPLLFLGDTFFMYVALFLAFIVRNKDIFLESKTILHQFFILYIFWVLILFLLNLYDLRFFKDRKDFFLSLAVFSVLSFLTSIIFLYFSSPISSNPKTILVLNILIFDILFYFWRYLFNYFLEIDYIKDRAMIIGSDLRLQEVLPQINKIYEVISFNNKEEIKDFIIKNKVKFIILCDDCDKELENNILKEFPFLNYISFGDIYESVTKKVCLDQLNETWFTKKISRQENEFEQIIKRSFDIVFSLIGCLVFIVLFPIIALLIKLDSEGNIIFKQNRVGKNGKIFTIYKFRTLRDKSKEDKELWREKNDDSLTNVGNFLRKTHLDELPQALNILKGDISFIGPRAEWQKLAEIFEKEIPFYKQRYIVKPGLVGWAQINFPASRSVGEAKEKFEYDLYYIKNHSILLDLEIILKSAKLFIQ
ncbi:MAG: exopolysaccharide biosynthesis polyprenyl glycosylphosphotransferase [Clostridia bacterium]